MMNAPLGNLVAAVMALVAAQSTPPCDPDVMSVNDVGYVEGQPWVTLQLVPGGSGGTAGWWVREQEIVFKVYGAGYDDTYTMASALLSLLTDKSVAPGWSSSGVLISDTDIGMEMAYLPDPQSDKPLITFSIRFTALPAVS